MCLPSVFSVQGNLPKATLSCNVENQEDFACWPAEAREGFEGFGQGCLAVMAVSQELWMMFRSRGL